MSVGRSGTAMRVGLILGVVVLVGVVAWLVWGRVSVGLQPDVQLVGKYIDGIQKGDLAAVRSTASGELLRSFPASQAAFAEDVKKSKSRIKSWRVTKIERNSYVGQSMIDVAVTTNAGTYNLEFDVFDSPSGLRIRAVNDLANPSRPGAEGDTGGAAGMTGGGAPHDTGG